MVMAPVVMMSRPNVIMVPPDMMMPRSMVMSHTMTVLYLLNQDVLLPN